MHLVHYRRVPLHVSLYPKGVCLTRPYSLPFIFQKLRVHRNLTRSSLAKKFGVSERYVNDVEMGVKYPSLDFCLRCACEFGANPEWVKRKWAMGVTVRFSDKIKERLGLDD